MALWHDTNGSLQRGITVSKLREILANLDDDDTIEGNEVGNLIVTHNNHEIAYIDVGADEGLVEFAGEPA